MCATDAARLSARRRRQDGSTLVVVSVATVTIAGLCLAMLNGSTSLYHGARSRVDLAKAFYVTEGGLDWVVGQLGNDPYFAAHDATQFPTANTDGSFETSWVPLGQDAGEFTGKVTYATVNALPPGWAGPGLPSGFQPFTPIVFADRTASPDFDRFLVGVRGRYNSTERACQAVLKMEFKAYGSALVSDAQPGTSNSTDPLTLARDANAIVFGGNNQHVWGGLRCNGKVYRASPVAVGGGGGRPVADALSEVTASDLAIDFPNFHGPFGSDLSGTSAEIPDYTAPGAAQQLFDFDQLRAAAQAGRGAYFASLAEFATAMNAANHAGQPLQGIIFVTVDANAHGSVAAIKSTGGHAVRINEGIRIKGTLALYVVNAPDDHYPVSIETPLHINAAPLPAGFDPANPQTFRSGYPPLLAPDKDPRTLAGFKRDDDLPALVTSNGALQIMRAANVCGLVYTPSFLRIENTTNERQYFDGGLVAGAGILAMGGSTLAGSQTITFDPATFDSLRTFDGLGKVPVFAGYLVDK